MTIFQSIVLAIVEGLTEYLPVSSTGHMIIASSFMGIASDPFVKFFTVAIQLGAILAVVALYFKRFFKSLDFYFKLLAAFIPSAVFGVLFSDKIDQLLESPLSVAIALLVGGIFLLFVDKIFDQPTAIMLHNSDKISYFTAFKIGLFQCLAMVPGVSRSAATTVGGMTQRLSRKAAAEFSFFLAVPTMFAATAKKALDYYKDGFTLSSDQIQLLAIGNVVAFVVALAAIKFFIDFLSKYGFRLFGVYRIIVGGVILAMILSGVKLQII